VLRFPRLGEIIRKLQFHQSTKLAMTLPNFPLVTLQSVADARHAWVSLLLECRPAAQGDELQRIFGEFGLAEALGPLPCIVVLDTAAVDLSDLPASQIILLLPSALLVDPAQAEQVAKWKAAGFRLMGKGLPPAGAALPAGVAALALSCQGEATPKAVIDTLAKLPGPHLALSTTTATCPGSCRFNWYVGSRTEHPQPTAAKSKEASNPVVLLDLLAKVTSDAEANEIETVIKRDPQLSYNLLKLVNSVGFSQNNKIKSFNQAITLLGRRQLQRWLQLLLYARNGKDQQASPLLSRAALRAGMLEALCRQAGGNRDAQDRAFMAGMFSLLDKLLGIPVADVVKPLNLAEDVVAALTSREGDLGVLLRAIELGEGPPGEALEQALVTAGVSTENWARALIQASQWAVQVGREG
jgi:EAL and modified HD-GYP domain-containing signal transduction protein